MTKYRGKGAALEMEISGAWTEVAQVANIAGPSLSKATRELTGPEDAASGWRRFAASWRTGGEIPVELLWDPALSTHNDTTGLLSRFLEDGLENYRIIFPDASSTTATFAGEFVAFEPASPVDGMLRLIGALQVSGPIEWS